MRLDRVTGQSSARGWRWKSVQAIEANIREKCKVLALLAAPVWRRGRSTNTFWEESVKKMSRKCLTFQICCSRSIGTDNHRPVCLSIGVFACRCSSGSHPQPSSVYSLYERHNCVHMRWCESVRWRHIRFHGVWFCAESTTFFANCGQRSVFLV